jgi:hypothetical protein
MKVICAWCEHEGRETLIGEIGLFDLDMTSHGICVDHEQVLLEQIDHMNRIQHPRLRRHGRLRAQLRSSSSSGLPNCATAWRRRRQHRTSQAQLSLPFNDDSTTPSFADQEWQLVSAGASGLEETT